MSCVDVPVQFWNGLFMKFVGGTRSTSTVQVCMTTSVIISSRYLPASSMTTSSCAGAHVQADGTSASRVESARRLCQS